MSQRMMLSSRKYPRAQARTMREEQERLEEYGFMERFGSHEYEVMS